MLYFALCRFVSKNKGQIQSKFDEYKFFFNLTPHSALSSSSRKMMLTVFAGGF